MSSTAPSSPLPTSGFGSLQAVSYALFENHATVLALQDAVQRAAAGDPAPCAATMSRAERERVAEALRANIAMHEAFYALVARGEPDPPTPVVNGSCDLNNCAVMYAQSFPYRMLGFLFPTFSRWFSGVDITVDAPLEQRLRALRRMLGLYREWLRVLELEPAPVPMLFPRCALAVLCVLAARCVLFSV